MNEQRLPVLYIPHGGGPMPLLGEPSHEALVEFLHGIPQQLGSPRAILVVSAHWETAAPTITAAALPTMLYDYSGFPPESYSIQYPAPGSPAVARQIQQCLQSAGITAQLDAERGFDHGLFVPLILMYPAADIPCMQLSLLNNLNPAQHIQLGRAIATLREQGVLVVGSGMSFHNMRAFYDTDDSPQAKDASAFHQWLIETCCDAELDNAQRESRLTQWTQAPGARYCHPREEHLIPLHVCFGAAGPDAGPAQLVFDERVLGKQVLGLLWE